MTWLDEFKVAILNKDTQKIENLINDLPNFDNISDLICAREMLGEFIENLKIEQNALSNAMKKLKRTRHLLED